MELSYEKKRRNLMITASAVIAATFLQLDRPSVILTALIGTSTTPEAWRFWVIVLITLIYQTWRLSTDKKTIILKEEVNNFYQINLERITKKSISNLARSEIKKIHKGKISKHADYDGNDIKKYKLKELYPSLSDRDTDGRIKSTFELLQETRPLTFSIYTKDTTTSLPRLVHSAELTLNKNLPLFKRIHWKLRALATSWIKSSDAQDLLVPMILSVAAVLASALKIHAHLSPIKVWI
ncbi:MAG: hypothetical protein ACTJHY_07840 [Alcaligenes pakistanensis]